MLASTVLRTLVEDAMTTAREIRCYDYVNRPFASVRRVIATDPAGLFQRATTTAAERARSLSSRLRVSFGGIEVGKDVRIEVTAVDPGRHPPGEHLNEGIALDLRWQATTDAGLFPVMRAELLVYPISPDETQLDLRGFYTPPLSVLGAGLDSLVGHRVAEASIHRFLSDVAQRLSVDAE